jgi:transcriptional regulator with XRE-family HTH domain
MEDARAVGERLRRLREALGFKSAAAFCRFAEIGETAWNNYERGRRRIDLDQALKLAARTGASLDWIYRGQESSLPVGLASKLRESADRLSRRA